MTNQNADDAFAAFFDEPTAESQMPVERTHRGVLHDMENLAEELETMWTVKDAIHTEDGNSIAGPSPRAVEMLNELSAAITAIKNEYGKAGKW